MHRASKESSSSGDRGRSSRSSTPTETLALFLPLAPAGVAASTPALVGTYAADLRYYEAVAQIIPLMLLVLALEQRYFFRRYQLPMSVDYKSERANRWQDRMDHLMARLSPPLLLLILAGGEGVALAGLASGSPDPKLFGLTVAALAGGLTAICLLAAAASRFSSDERPSRTK